MKCWYCNKETMSECPGLGSSWFKCSECGATWTVVPKPHFNGVVVEKVIEGEHETKYRPYQKRRRKQDARLQKH